MSAGASPSAAPREGYDLATEREDYPAREEPPDRTVVICSHPRSGSTLLCEAIHAAGGLGCPLEYLHRGFRPHFARRWRGDLAAYVRAMHRFRTDASGVFSIKVFWRDVEETAVELQPDAPIARRDVAPDDSEMARLFEMLLQLMPNPTFVYLTRRDRVRQAISAFMAAETNTFRAFSRDEVSARAVKYQYEGILRQLAAADYGNARWRDFFSANRIDPYRVEYEALASSYPTAVSNVLAHLGHSGTVPAPRMQRQATAQSEDFILRFLQDHEAACRPSANRGWNKP